MGHIIRAPYLNLFSYCLERLNCSDSIDNDLDGLIDCDDQDCIRDVNCSNPAPVPAPAPAPAPVPAPAPQLEEVLGVEETKCDYVVANDDDFDEGTKMVHERPTFVKGPTKTKVEEEDTKMFPFTANGEEIPTPNTPSVVNTPYFNLKVSFKRNKDREDYDHKVVTMVSPLDVARRKPLQTQKWKEERGNKGVQSYYPPNRELGALLSSKGIHFTIFYKPYTKEEEKKVKEETKMMVSPHGRYLIRVEARKKPMTNPFWALLPGEKDWMEVDAKEKGFTIELVHGMQLSVGGHFHFKVAFNPISFEEHTRMLQTAHGSTVVSEMEEKEEEEEEEYSGEMTGYRWGHTFMLQQVDGPSESFEMDTPEYWWLAFLLFPFLSFPMFCLWLIEYMTDALPFFTLLLGSSPQYRNDLSLMLLSQREHIRVQHKPADHLNTFLIHSISNYIVLPQHREAFKVDPWKQARVGRKVGRDIRSVFVSF